MYNDTSLKQLAADKRTLAAWKQAVSYQGKALEAALANIPPELRAGVTSPAVVELIAGLLRIRPKQAFEWLLHVLKVEAVTPEWHTPPFEFLRVRLAAFADLLKRGHDPAGLVRAARSQYAELRPFLRLPNLEVILEAYAAVPSARSKKPRRSARRSSSRSA